MVGRRPLAAVLCWCVAVVAPRIETKPIKVSAVAENEEGAREVLAINDFNSESVPAGSDTSNLLFFDKGTQIKVLEEPPPGGEPNPWVRGRISVELLKLDMGGNNVGIPLRAGKKGRMGWFPLAYTDGSSWFKDEIKKNKEQAEARELQGFASALQSGQLGGVAGGGDGSSCES